MERISTGIIGLDEIIEGGFIRGSSILLKGPSGSGKTLSGLQFLHNGVTEKNEHGLMVQIQGHYTDIEWYQDSFGWDFSSLSSEKKIIFTKFSSNEFSKFEPRTVHSDVVLPLYKIIEEAKVKRVVFDSVAPLGHVFYSESGAYRNLLYSLVKALKEKNVTSLFISESRTDGTGFFDEEDFVFDGVLRFSRAVERTQWITQIDVGKMVATDTPKQPFPVDVTRRGLVVIPSF